MEDVIAFIQEVKQSNPEFGFKRVCLRYFSLFHQRKQILAEAKEKKTDWELGEKRLKKIMQDNGLMASQAGEAGAEGGGSGSGAAATPAAGSAKKKATGGAALVQTKPEPTIPVKNLYPGGDFPVGEIQEYNEAIGWRSDLDARKARDMIHSDLYKEIRQVII